MKCPACEKTLYKLMDGEYACHNPDCPARDGPFGIPEWYGLNQKEINEMWNK